MSNTPSPVENIKSASRRLRGTLRESHADPMTGAIADADRMLFMFLGC